MVTSYKFYYVLSDNCLIVYISCREYILCYSGIVNDDCDDVYVYFVSHEYVNCDVIDILFNHN